MTMTKIGGGVGLLFFFSQNHRKGDFCVFLSVGKIIP